MHIASSTLLAIDHLYLGVDTGFSRDGKAHFVALLFEVAADGRVCWDGAQLFDPLTMLLLAYERNIAQQGELAPGRTSNQTTAWSCPGRHKVAR